jgi:hypothetical protein
MTMKLAPALLAIPLLLPSVVADAADVPGKRTLSIIVYGDDPCPQADTDEIVVCGRRPDNERYRIPKELRKKEANDTLSETSWASRVGSLEDAQRSTRPDSCSASGSWGQTGCFQQMLHQWYEDRQQLRSEAANVP